MRVCLIFWDDFVRAWRTQSSRTKCKSMLRDDVVCWITQRYNCADVAWWCLVKVVNMFARTILWDGGSAMQKHPAVKCLWWRKRRILLLTSTSSNIKDGTNFSIKRELRPFGKIQLLYIHEVQFGCFCDLNTRSPVWAYSELFFNRGTVFFSHNIAV